jgi:hypothetical protein
MLALPDTQACLMDALLGRSDGAAAAALLRTNSVLTTRQRLQVYRNNVCHSLIAALGAVYPVVARLVGEAFFRHTAKAYIRAHPSRSGNLHDFGAELPAFLRVFAPATSLPYLSDVAMLEWAYHRAYHAVEQPALEAACLAQVPAADQPDLRFEIQPCARFVASHYPVLKIWRANQTPDDDTIVSLNEGGVNLLVVQHELEIEFRLLTKAESRWLCALADGATLGEATREALDADAAFDLAARLARHFSLGLFTGMTLARMRTRRTT